MVDIAEDVLTLYHLIHPRELISRLYDYPELWHRLPWALLAFGVAVGGIIFVYLFKSILACGLPHRYNESYVLSGRKNGKHRYVRRRTHNSRSYYRVFLETFFIVGVFLVIWIACWVAGFNFLSSPLMSVGMGLIGSYMFGVAIQQFGSGYWVNVEAMVAEEQYLRFPLLGPEAHGRVTEIHPFFILLQRLNAKGTGLEDIKISMSDVMTQTMVRDYEEEAKVPPRYEYDPNEPRRGMRQPPDAQGARLKDPLHMV